MNKIHDLAQVFTCARFVLICTSASEINSDLIKINLLFACILSDEPFISCLFILKYGS